jgi:hypothetical protein
MIGLIGDVFVPVSFTVQGDQLCRFGGRFQIRMDANDVRRIIQDDVEMIAVISDTACFESGFVCLRQQSFELGFRDQFKAIGDHAGTGRCVLAADFPFFLFLIPFLFGHVLQVSFAVSAVVSGGAGAIMHQIDDRSVSAGERPAPGLVVELKSGPL